MNAVSLEAGALSPRTGAANNWGLGVGLHVWSVLPSAGSDMDPALEHEACEKVPDASICQSDRGMFESPLKMDTEDHFETSVSSRMLTAFARLSCGTGHQPGLNPALRGEAPGMWPGDVAAACLNHAMLGCTRHRGKWQFLAITSPSIPYQPYPCSYC
jgi:hypothetical protein